MRKIQQRDFQLTYGDIALRQLKEEDIEQLIRWYTVQTEWQKWDAPWEHIDRNEEELRASLEKAIKRPLRQIPGRLLIAHVDGPVIGWVNTYLINKDPEKRAVGIDICESSYWGRGLGYQALNLWIGLLFHLTDLKDIHCETWSGNLRMIALANKCGFTEVKREKNKREVNGKLYDGLTFKLTRERFVDDNRELVNTIAAQL